MGRIPANCAVKSHDLSEVNNRRYICSMIVSDVNMFENFSYTITSYTQYRTMKYLRKTVSHMVTTGCVCYKHRDRKNHLSNSNFTKDRACICSMTWK